MIIPSADLTLSTAVPSLVFSDTLIVLSSADLVLSTVVPVVNFESSYWNSGVVVSDQISSMGFSMPGHGPGMFLEIRASDPEAWEVISIEVPRR